MGVNGEDVHEMSHFRVDKKAKSQTLDCADFFGGFKLQIL